MKTIYEKKGKKTKSDRSRRATNKCRTNWFAGFACVCRSSSINFGIKSFTHTHLQFKWYRYACDCDFKFRRLSLGLVIVNLSHKTTMIYVSQMRRTKKKLFPSRLLGHVRSPHWVGQKSVHCIDHTIDEKQKKQTRKKTFIFGGSKTEILESFLSLSK